MDNEMGSIGRLKMTRKKVVGKDWFEKSALNKEDGGL